MALISMCVNDTTENKRTEYTMKTLSCLVDTVNCYSHKIIVVDNNSCVETKKYLKEFREHVHSGLEIVTLAGNLGTAEGINKAWQHRKPGEHCIKIDNDVVIHKSGWVEEMQECIRLSPKIGIIGLKRKDCWETPWHPDPFYRSELAMLHHLSGEPWRIVEKVNHVMGTCQMYNSALLDKMGYLYQPGLYGFDDALAAVRCKVGGFYSCFLPHINIDHIDTGETAYQGWKEKHSGELMEEFHKKKAYYESTGDIYYNPFD